MKTLSKQKKEKKEEEDLNDIVVESPDDLFYFSKAEKKYKVYNPKDKTWALQDARPSELQI